jgi:putative ABC transport system permease protein
MESLLRDFRHAARMLLKSPRFTAITITTLALAIGATSTIFSVVNTVLFRPLPYKNSDRLVRVYETLPQGAQGAFSFPEFTYLKTQKGLFEHVATQRVANHSLKVRGEAEEIHCEYITDEFLSLYSISPILGRAFLPQEYKYGFDNVAIISYLLWQRRFNSDTSIIGQSIELNDKSYIVVGVMSSQFSTSDVIWLPLSISPEVANNLGLHQFGVVARLRPGISIEQSRRELDLIKQKYAEAHHGWNLQLYPLQELIVGNARSGLLLLFGAVGCILLIACVNVANLILTRASGRQKEIAIRLALGSNRFRLIRLLLAESLLLSGLGGGIGLLLAFWGIKLFIAINPPGNLPRVDEIGADLRMVIFAIAISLLTGIIFGLAPALQATKPDLNSALKEGMAQLEIRSRFFRRHRLYSLLVVAEITMAQVLLICAGLFMKSYMRVQEVNPGFNPENLLIMRVSLPQFKYQEVGQITSFWQQLIEQSRALPVIQSVGTIANLPFTEPGGMTGFAIEGKIPKDPSQFPRTGHSIITPNYFQAMGIPLKQGRQFTERDNQGSSKVIIVSESMARQFWQAEDCIGKRIAFDGTLDNPNWREIVGVVGDVRQLGLEDERRSEMYIPHLQSFNSITAPNSPMYLVLRLTSNSINVAADIRHIVRGLDNSVMISRITTMEKLVSASVASRRFNMLILSILAGTALGLAAMGIYGIMAHSVSNRTREIGIRLALGAQQHNVLNIVMREGATLALTGAIIGMAGSFSVTRYISSLLYGVSSIDPVTVISASLMLLLVALLGTYIPAYRGSKVDPLITLRGQ